MTDCTGLSSSTTTRYINTDINGTGLFGGAQRSNHHFPLLLSCAVFVVWAVVDSKSTGAFLDTDTGCTGLTTTSGYKFFSGSLCTHNLISLEEEGSVFELREDVLHHDTL